MSEDQEKHQTEGSNFKSDLFKRINEGIDTGKKIVVAITGIATATLAALGWTMAWLATLPIPLLVLSSILLLLVGTILMVWGGSLLWMRAWKWTTLGLFVISLLNLGLGGIVWYSLPPPPTWTTVAVPYEKSITGSSPLVQVRDELILPGFPGRDRFKDLLHRKRATVTPFPQQYVAFVSSEFSRNRFPNEIRVLKSAEYAVAAYVFKFEKGAEKSQTKTSVSRVGFEDVASELKISPPPEPGLRYAMAVILFPLTLESASDMQGGLNEFVVVK